MEGLVGSTKGTFGNHIHEDIALHILWDIDKSAMFGRLHISPA